MALGGERLEPHPQPPLVDPEWVLDRPGRDLVARDDELRAEDLGSPLGHPDPIEQAGVVRRVRVAALDRGLEMLERAVLEVGVGELDDEPRGAFAVRADEPSTRPRLVVVEDRPEAVGARRVSCGSRECEELGAKRLVDRLGARGHRRAGYGVSLRSALVRRLLPGLATTLSLKEAYRQAWAEEARRALETDGPLWVALGDSTAQGIGASAYDQGYVGQLRRLLEARDRRAWRVINLSVTGARVRDVLDLQVPRLDALDARPDLVTCAVGANDMLRPGVRRVLAVMSALIERLPAGSLLATLPQGVGRRRPAAINELIASEASRRGLVIVDLWSHTGPPWDGRLAADRFHPNDVGYRAWTAVFAEALKLSVEPDPPA